MLSPYSRLSRPLQMGANIMGAVLSVLYAARNGLMDCEVSCELFASAAAVGRSKSYHLTAGATCRAGHSVVSNVVEPVLCSQTTAKKYS